MMPAGVFGSLRRHPSGALLAVQLLGLLFYPLMEDTGAGRALFNTFAYSACQTLYPGSSSRRSTRERRGAGWSCCS